MRYLIALALTLALVAVIAVAVVAWINSPAQQDAIRQQSAVSVAKAAADLRASQESAAWWQSLRENLTPLLLLVAGVLAGVVMLGTTGAVGIWLARKWDKREAERGRLQPVGGQVSVSLAQADQAALMATAGYWQAQIEQAKRPAFSGAARSERIQIQNGHAAPALPNRPAVELPPPVSAPMLPGPVALSSALTWQPDLTRVLIGLDQAGQPIAVSARDLCHVALVGHTGGGKSNAMRLLLGQLLAAGARAVLLDPHYAPFDPDDQVTGDWRPIEHRLYRPPAVLPSELAATFDWLNEELDERLARRRAGERNGPPLFCCIDELPSIVAQVDQAPNVLTRIVREGRKVGLLAITSSQDFLVKSIGTGSAARDSFRTAVYAGGDAHSAAVLLDMPRRAIDDGPLGRGTVLLRSAATPQAALARLPLVTDADLTRLLPMPSDQAAGPRPMLPISDFGNPPAPASRPPLTVLPGGAGVGASTGAFTGASPENGDLDANTPVKSASTSTGTARSTSLEDRQRQRIRELAEQGVSRNSISQIIFGHKNAATMAIIRDALGDQAQAAEGD